MTEHYTEALVLDKEELADFDSRVFLYSRDLGRVIAKATSVRKITSKLAAHLEPGNFIKARLVQSDSWRFQVADALKTDFLPKTADFINILNLVKELTAEGQADEELWDLLQLKNLSGAKFLKILGFDNKFALCQNCGAENPAQFLLKELEYSCIPCFVKSGRPPSFALK